MKKSVYEEFWLEEPSALKNYESEEFSVVKIFFILKNFWLKYTMAACAGVAIVNVSKYSKGWLGKGWIFGGGHFKGWPRGGLGF